MFSIPVIRVMEKLNISEDDLFALKTVCDAIYYCLEKYDNKKISHWDWSTFSHYSGIPLDAPYTVELEKNGFLLSIPGKKIRYVHNDYSHEKRLIIIT